MLAHNTQIEEGNSATRANLWGGRKCLTNGMTWCILQSTKERKGKEKMDFTISGHTVTIKRWPNEARMRNESDLLYRIKRELNALVASGFHSELIKVLMHKHWHLVPDTQYYLVQRNARKVHNPVMIYDNFYASRNSAKAFNKGEVVCFSVTGDVRTYFNLQ